MFSMKTGAFAETRCNRAGVDLEPCSTRKISRCCSNLISNHVDYTGSPRGQWILENWAEMLPKFVKVFPHEFKRVLGVPRAAEQFKMSPQLARRRNR